jgi:hypothetical protein
MTDDEFAAIVGIADQQLAQAQTCQAQACLDLFEKDRGRRAASALEVRNWADVQDPETLRFRILRRLRSDQAWTKAVKRIWIDIPASLASRPPIGQRISLTLAEAAKITGLSEDAIFDAIAHGRIAGMQDLHDVWHVERAELLNLFPSLRGGVVRSDAANVQPLDATTLMLEVGISALIRQSGDKLRRRRFWWRRAG